MFKKTLSPIQQVNLSILNNKKVRLYVKREDMLHKYISGNKYRKLKYNLIEAKSKNHDTILTFGGAFSNHISATAVAGKEVGFKTIGVIRGDELGINLDRTLKNNPTLAFAFKQGMQFYFVSRTDYRQKTSEEFIDKLKNKFGKFYLVPEGGTNKLAVKGCEEILTENESNFNVITVPVGTGGTISGLINSAKKHQTVIGFSALKGNFLIDEINKYVISENWKLNTDYHFGGYAKINAELIDFINKFKEETNIPLDPIYTGKMMFGIVDLILNDYFSENSNILAIHTGGLQGIEGMNNLLKRKKLPLLI